MNGFAGADSPKTEWTSLLPFPEDAGVESKSTISKRTTRILKNLIASNQIPSFVLSSVLRSSPELAEFVSDEK
jgi:hypothetical protein